MPLVGQRLRARLVRKVVLYGLPSLPACLRSTSGFFIGCAENVSTKKRSDNRPRRGISCTLLNCVAVFVRTVGSSVYDGSTSINQR